jgi:hypothetical protein
MRFTRPGGPSARQTAIRRAQKKKKKYYAEINGEIIELLRPLKKKEQGDVRQETE